MNSETAIFTSYQKQTTSYPCNSTYPSDFYFHNQIYKLKFLLNFPIGNFSTTPPIIAFYPDRNLAQGFDNIYFFNAYLHNSGNHIEISNLSLTRKIEDNGSDYHLSSLFQETLPKVRHYSLKQNHAANMPRLLLLDDANHILMIFEPDTFNFNL